MESAEPAMSAELAMSAEPAMSAERGMTKCQKVLKTVFLVLVWVCLVSISLTFLHRLIHAFYHDICYRPDNLSLVTFSMPNL